MANFATGGPDATWTVTFRDGSSATGGGSGRAFVERLQTLLRTLVPVGTEVVLNGTTYRFTTPQTLAVDGAWGDTTTAAIRAARGPGVQGAADLAVRTRRISDDLLREAALVVSAGEFPTRPIERIGLDAGTTPPTYGVAAPSGQGLFWTGDLTGRPGVIPPLPSLPLDTFVDSPIAPAPAPAPTGTTAGSTTTPPPAALATALATAPTPAALAHSSANTILVAVGVTVGLIAIAYLVLRDQRAEGLQAQAQARAQAPALPQGPPRSAMPMLPPPRGGR